MLPTEMFRYQAHWLANLVTGVYSKRIRLPITLLAKRGKTKSIENRLHRMPIKKSTNVKGLTIFCGHIIRKLTWNSDLSK